MTEKEQIQKMVKDAVKTLSEHCDSVRILVTKHACDGETDTTAQIDNGAGNFYAQLGQVREWLCIQEQYQRNWAIRKDDTDNPANE
jgi:hypothetical protein